MSEVGSKRYLGISRTPLFSECLVTTWASIPKIRKMSANQSRASILGAAEGTADQFIEEEERRHPTAQNQVDVNVLLQNMTLMMQQNCAILQMLVASTHNQNQRINYAILSDFSKTQFLNGDLYNSSWLQEIENKTILLHWPP